MNEQELKDAVSAICQRFGVKGGFLLAYLNEDKIGITGNLSLAEIAPLLLKYTISKFDKEK